MHRFCPPVGAGSGSSRRGGGAGGKKNGGSPDGRWIGFFTAGGVTELKKVSVAGGSPITLCQIKGRALGASWGADDTIVFATNDSSTGLMRVSASGGETTVLTTPDARNGEAD